MRYDGRVGLRPTWRTAVVGAPSHFAAHELLKTPQDVKAHSCINLRLAIHGSLDAWEFEESDAK
jgi:hypothetical protein